MTYSSSVKNLPQVIFFDAMGTLFDLKSSVGEIYQKCALKYNVRVDAQLVNDSFISSFKSAPPLAFSTEELTAIEQQEFVWWKNVVQTTFSQIDRLEKFSSFTDFFREIYDYFATKEPWHVFPDVIPALKRCKQKNIQLGIISNFDTRLIRVIKLLDLEKFFTSITISSIAGSAKPEQNIFQQALKKHNITADRAWHIGDSIIEDYQGAKDMRINSFWLNRKGVSRNIENQLPNLSSLG